MVKVALTTGLTGQDGWYLAELLLEMGYGVHENHEEKNFESLIMSKNIFSK